MQKEEAEKYLKNIIFDEETQLCQYLKVNNKNGGMRCIKQITGCDDFTCEDIYTDLYYIVSEKNRKEEERRRPSGTGIHLPTCPTCGSTNVQHISGLERGASIFGFGVFSRKLNKTYKCLNCKYMW